MWGMGIFNAIVGEVTASRASKRKREDAAVDVETETAKSTRGHTQTVAIQRLRNRGKDPRMMQRATLLLFAMPFVVLWFNSAAVDTYFATMESIPEWYKATFLSMVSVIWGVDQYKKAKAGV
jgi:hypothetical protein